MFVLFTSHAALRRAAGELRAVLGDRWPHPGAGRGAQGRAAAALPRGGERHPAGHRFVLGGRGRARAARSAPWSSTSYLSRSHPSRSPPPGSSGWRRRGTTGSGTTCCPHAALKLKQGFGRLIRSRQDVGVVVLLDSRVVTKRYGPLLLDGLPRAERVIGSWAQVRTKCEDFFARHGIGAIV